MRPFKFAIGEKLKISASGEIGEVCGRAEYAHSSNTYWLRYKAADGRAVESWWSEEALERADSEFAAAA